MTAPRRKLIEVGLPLEAINRQAVREKSIRSGHPSALHLWWSRLPLAVARSVIFAQMVDDPDCDPAYREPGGSVDEERAGIKRAELFTLIEELVKWENTNNDCVINAARAEIARCVASDKIERGELEEATIVWRQEAAAGRQDASDASWHSESGPRTSGFLAKGQLHPHGPLPQDGRTATASEIVSLRAKPEAVNAFLAEHAPPFYDPFAGGGSLPLEAQRLGLVVHASDLDPVAVMINKAMIQIPPRFAGRPPVNPEGRQNRLGTRTWKGVAGLADDVRYYGQWMRDEAEKRIGHLYPKIQVTVELAKDRPDLEPYVGQELTVIAWRWARTVESSNPAYRGCHVPLVSSFWLSTKTGKEAYVEPVIEGKTYRFEVRTGKPRDKTVVDAGTRLGRGANFRCLLSQSPMSPEHIQAEGMAGRMGARLIAIVAEGGRSRVYLPPIEEHEQIARQANPSWKPEQEFFPQALGFRIGSFGLTKWSDLFTPRQLVALTTFCGLVAEARKRILQDFQSRNRVTGEPPVPGNPADYAVAVSVYLAFALDKQADLGNSLCRWEPSAQCPRQLFGRQAISMIWDYAESNPLGNSSEAWTVFIDGIADTLAKAFGYVTPNSVGWAQQANALMQTISSGKVVSTDPPCRDNIGYADRSDFFYVWLQRAMQPALPELFPTVPVPKAEELVANPARHGSMDAAKTFYTSGLTQALYAIAEQAHRRFPVTLHCASKQAAGWETFLGAVLDAGLAPSGVWPMRTDHFSRLKAHVSNTHASSIAVVCRPRPPDAPVTTRKDFLTALRRGFPPALRRVQRAGIAPVDLASAIIGPGMAIFAGYSRILEADGKPMTVRTALQLIKQTLDDTLAEQECDFDAETVWAVAWFEKFAFNDGPFGDAEMLSRVKNTTLNALATASIVKVTGGKARLLRLDELPSDWEPGTERRFTVWEIVHHLIRLRNTGGETAAARLVAKLDTAADLARELAYRLYSICERRKRTDESLVYNALIQDWPEIIKGTMKDGGAPRPRCENKKRS